MNLPPIKKITILFALALVSSAIAYMLIAFITLDLGWFMDRSVDTGFGRVALLLMTMILSVVFYMIVKDDIR